MSRNPSKRAAAARATQAAAAGAKQQARAGEPRRIGDWAGAFLLAVVAGLEVIVPLIPSETVAMGPGPLLALGWLLLLLFGLGLLLGRGKQQPWDIVSLLTLGLGAWLLASAVVRAWDGNPRATWNSAWHWIGLLAGYWAVRLLVRVPTSQRALFAVMIALAATLAAHGMYQFTVGFPLQRREYRQATEEEKQRLLRANGIDPAAHSPARRQFENRLLESTEPFATFGLANSLAGVLAPWLVMAAGLLTSSAVRRNMTGWRMGLLAALALTILMCLVLTKSRAAWLGVVGGASIILLARWRTGSRQNVKRAAWGLVAIAAAVLAGIVSGALDRQVLTEAGISVAYRLQYWRAAIAMTIRHPWFGCGPGNFQDYYTRYKLPWASETVADPHNLVFEAAANGGLMAGAVLLGLLLAVCSKLARRSKLGAERRPAGSPAPEISAAAPAAAATEPMQLAAASPRARLPVYFGGAVGLLVSIAVSVDSGFPPELIAGLDLPLVWVLGLPLFVLTFAVLDPWVRDGTMPRELLLGAWVALAVNLMAAGGISFPGVAQSFWLLAAVGVARGEREGAGSTATNRGRWLMRAGIAVTAGLAFGCWLSSVQPTRAAGRWMSVAERADSYERAADYYTLAANADPWDPRPWQWLAEIYQLHWLESREPQLRGDFEQALAEAERRDSQAYAFAMRRGWLYLRAFRATGDSAELTAAIEAYQRACALYPNSNFAHAQWAWALSLAGQPEAARRQAAEALALDRLNPHIEQKLAQRRLDDPALEMTSPVFGPPPPEGNAELVVRELRTAKEAAP